MCPTSADWKQLLDSYERRLTEDRCQLESEREPRGGLEPEEYREIIDLLHGVLRTALRHVMTLEKEMAQADIPF